MPMIVLGADTHKASHTVGAVDAATGQVIDDKTVAAKRHGFEDLLVWRAAWQASASGRSKIAGMSPVAWSASCWPVASASCGSLRS